MQDPILEEIDLTHIVWYFSELERLGWKPSGMNLIGLALKKFFEFCHLRGYNVSFSEQLIPIREKECNIPRVANIKDFKKLLARIPTRTNRPHHIRNRAFLLLLWDTGARSGELCMLDDDDLKFDRDGSGTAYIKTEKSRGRRPIRQIFWTAETGKTIKRWLKKKNELQKLFTFQHPEAVFTTITKSPGSAIRGSRMNSRGIAEVMRMLSNGAGLSVVANAHSIRHSFGRDTKKATGSDFSVGNQLGHSSPDSSRIYAWLFDEEMKKEWKTIMKKRGSPVRKAPVRAMNFPKLRNTKRAFVRSPYRPTTFRRLKTGRLGRS
ncbi:MAG: site-specific integrase [Bacteroidia bacterium]